MIQKLSGEKSELTIEQRAARVRLLLTDVDGVMTDGKLFNVPGPDGKMWETKGFDAQDGIALQWLGWYGITCGLISGRVSPDGREITRDPEMFAIELSGRTLLFPSPRGGYRPAFDAYFERANVASWNRCLQPALMQKVGDNLLSVIARGICG